jgi:hypothetical protein
VSPRADLAVVAKKKIRCFCREPNADYHSPSLCPWYISIESYFISCNDISCGTHCYHCAINCYTLVYNSRLRVYLTKLRYVTLRCGKLHYTHTILNCYHKINMRTDSGASRRVSASALNGYREQLPGYKPHSSFVLYAYPPELPYLSTHKVSPFLQTSFNGSQPSELEQR